MRPKHPKPDTNQSQIVNELRNLGVVVWVTASLATPILDLVAFWRGIALVVEVKVPGAEKRLTDGEREGIRKLAQVGVEVVVATCTEDVVTALDKRALTKSLPTHYICAHCEEFSPISPYVDLLDSGTTLLCSCGERTVVDLSTPENRQ